MILTTLRSAALLAAGLMTFAALPAWSQQQRAAPGQIPRAVAAPVQRQAAPAPAAPVPAPQCDASKFRVIVDVGHTPEIPGAISARGVNEYDFNLKLAKVIERKLNEAGYARTSLLLANGPAIPSLVRRIAQANQTSADLLISIHHDSVPQMFKAVWEFGGKKMEYSDRFRGHSIFVSADNANYQASLEFGKLLGAQMKARGLQYTPHYTQAFMGNKRRQLVDAESGVYRYDQLLILRHTRMPTVLLEAGSIINRDEEVLMGTEEHQAKIAGAVTEAVDRFCALRAGTKTQRASAH
jgi:N-acetylmuramoyl-L-alanine amidase